MEEQALETTSAEPRWQAPEMVDRASFLAAHPECVVSPEIFARLEPEIDHYASWIRRRSDELTSEDIKSEVVARILECATFYRHTDEEGQPIYDFLAQSTKYIVMHAAGKVSSELRRSRNHQEVTVSYDAPIDVSAEGEEGDEMLVTIADTSATVDTANLEVADLIRAVEERLRSDPKLRDDVTTHQVWELTLTGHDRTDIGALLGIRRQRVHERCAKLRTIIAEIDPAAVVGRVRASGSEAMFV